MSKWVTVAADGTDTAAGGLVVGNVLVEQLRVNDDFAGSSYPIADGWQLGSIGNRESSYESTTHSTLTASQPPLLHLGTDVSHGTGCTSLSGSISTILTLWSWICMSIHRLETLPSPVLA